MTAVRILYHWVHRDLTYGFYIGSTVGAMSNSSFRGVHQKEHRDFDDGANALWCLYWKEAKTHDEARFESMAKNMDGVLVFVRDDYRDRDTTSIL